MPTYEYACRSCGEQLEVVQSFTDDPLTTCGACGGPLRKVFGAVGISFKGSGFYKTDSRKGSSTPASPSARDAGGTDGGDTGTGKKDGAKEPATTSGGDAAGGSKPAAPAAAPKPSSAPSSTG